MNKESRLLELIKQKAVEKKSEGFMLASGIKSNLYVDLRKISLDPEGINLIGSLILSKVRELAPEADCVGGLETGSIPISTAVALLSERDLKPLNAFWVRKKLKDHGMQNLIEGNVRKGSRVVILDDVITTGGSSFQAAEAVKNFGAKVIQAIAIVDRGATENFRKSGIPYFAFFTEKDLEK
ncbi:MAG: orotate phosphoribosyltransferase [Nitrososphaerota archaeon]|nr:orotate phosphoribosyltransferase [Nitrososphaerota archaeon]